MRLTQAETFSPSPILRWGSRLSGIRQAKQCSPISGIRREAFSIWADGIKTAPYAERISAYRQGGADEIYGPRPVFLEHGTEWSRYPSLQFAEIALRNAIHKMLSDREIDKISDHFLTTFRGIQKDSIGFTRVPEKMALTPSKADLIGLSE